MKIFELPRLAVIACLSVGILTWTACGSETVVDETADTAKEKMDDAAAAGDAADTDDAATDAALEAATEGDATAGGDGELGFAQDSWGWNIYNFMETGSGSQSFNLDKIPLGEDEAEASAEGKKQLDDLAAILKAYPDMTCEVQGHTKEAKNPVGRTAKQVWSKGRALWVQGKLAARGVDGSQMKAKGYADKQLIEGVPGDDDSQRRVVVVFTK